MSGFDGIHMAVLPVLLVLWFLAYPSTISCPESSYAPLVQKVLDLFRPGRFSAVVFANELSACGRSTMINESSLVGYKPCNISQRSYNK